MMQLFDAVDGVLFVISTSKREEQLFVCCFCFLRAGDKSQALSKDKAAQVRQCVSSAKLCAIINLASKSYSANRLP